MKPLNFITLLCFVFFACNGQPYQKDKPVVNNELIKPEKQAVQREVLSEIDYNRVFEQKIIDSLPIERLDIGLLKVPTGKIVACDPLVFSSVIPFNKTVEPGTYPVILYVAKTGASGDRYAIAKLEFSKQKADKWVLALHDGEDTRKLTKPDDFFGFPVDAGLGGFFDHQAGSDYQKFLNKFQQEHPSGNIYTDYLQAEFKKNAKAPNDPKDDGDWVNLKIPGSDLNITMFHSGFGDGSYPAYWGMTKDNKIVSLVIDFLVLPFKEK